MGVKSSILLFVLFLCYCKINFAQPIANGFIFGNGTMSRFSFDDPGTLADSKKTEVFSEPRNWYEENHLTFANRSWLFYLSGWGSGRYFFNRVDTATGEVTTIDMEPQMNFNARLKGMSYEKSSNSIYFLTKESGNPRKKNFLRRIDLSFRGSPQVHVCTINDSIPLHGFSIGADGFGYSFNDTGALDKFNLSTGEVIIKVPSGIKGADIMDAVFNPVNGKLYVLVIRDSSYTELRTVNISSGKSERITSWDGIYTNLAISGDVYAPPLSAPELVSPLGHIDSFSPRLVWKSVPGAIGYYLNYSPQYGLVNKNWWDWNVVYDTSFQINDKVFDDSFNNYWWVAAFDSTGTGLYSKIGVTGFYAEDKK